MQSKRKESRQPVPLFGRAPLTTARLPLPNNHAPKNSTCVLAAKFAAIASMFLWIHQTYFNGLWNIILPANPSTPVNSFYAPDFVAVSSNNPIDDIDSSASENNNNEDEADVIVRRAYESTYAHILPCDDDLIGEKCLQKTIDFFKPRTRKPNSSRRLERFSQDDEENHFPGRMKSSYSPYPNKPPNYEETMKSTSNQSVPSIPWWFQTFLRDLPKNGAFGWWHQMTSANPPLKFCTIAKVATTDWHDVFCKLNPVENTVCERNVTSGEERCKTICDNFTTDQELPADTPRAVFLRDPLERLLSAFLNKCYDDDSREERHCEPNVIFNPNENEINVREDSGEEEPLLEDIRDNDQHLFAAYVDVMPLKWNLHVVPQAFACDLYRNIRQQYDFVGIMGQDFMMDLDRMAHQFGGPLPEFLNDTFGYQKYVSKEWKHVNVGQSNNMHATLAPTKVTRFYTAQSVRKALEYMSIDYVLLGLEVPEWARKMLIEDQ